METAVCTPLNNYLAPVNTVLTLLEECEKHKNTEAQLHKHFNGSVCRVASASKTAILTPWHKLLSQFQATWEADFRMQPYFEATRKYFR